MEKIRTYLKRGEEAQLHAGKAMESLLRLLRFDPALYAVFEIWDRETRGLIRGCEASGIQGTRLCVKVPSAAHRQEILYLKDRLLSRVNQALGRRVITDIQFELGGTTGVQEQARTGLERYGKR